MKFSAKSPFSVFDFQSDSPKARNSGKSGNVAANLTPFSIALKMEIVESIAGLKQIVRPWRNQGERIAIVPTMGALHDGHLSLVDTAKRCSDRVIATIFVNPTQFAPHEDLAKYPRTLDADCALLADRGVDAVFCPTNELMYPAGFSTHVSPPHVARKLEGEFRPTHFQGVCTVVLKLLNLSEAALAVFGQKDFQQVAVIKAMVRDLNHNCEIMVAPICRDPDGLAMSSRNRFLSPPERQTALAIRRSLLLAAEQLRTRTKPLEAIQLEMQENLRHGGIHDIDYATIANPDTLEPATDTESTLVILIACRVGNTRLIDNELITL
ncbi:MAG: pantoate--beta-alanine ligase [Pirellulaceae bacterium]